MLHSNRARNKIDRDASIFPLFLLQQSRGENLWGGAVVDNLTTMGVAGYGRRFVIYTTSSGQEDALSHLVRSVLVANEPWRARVTDPLADTDLDSLQETADAAFAQVREYGPESIDLSTLTPGEVNGEHLAIFLRCLYSWKDIVPSWQNAVAVAADALVAEGKKPKSSLYGLV